jgi:hypothetical protein
MKIRMVALATQVMLGIGSLCGGAVYAQTALSATAVEASFAGKTIVATENVSLVFSDALATGDGQFAVLVGNEDLTTNFRWVSPTQLDGVFAAMPLPAGESVLKVYRIGADNQWIELAQLAISVAAPIASVAKPSVVKPTLIVGIKSQVAQSHSDNATPSTRGNYQDLTLQAGLQTEHGTADWSVKSQLNLAGSSYHPEAVDFGNQGEATPKLDIANYLVESSFTNRAGTTGISAGHIQAGAHPLLANSIANRGVSLSHKFGERLDLATAIQNGTGVVGGNNLTGLNDPEHRLITSSVGLELMPRAGGLRLETTLFKGTVKPKLTTGVAILQDAEESRGAGLRAKAQNQEGSLRADLAYARSTYTPKGDSTLNIAAGPSSTGTSWYADLGYDVLKNIAVAKDYPLSLTAQVKHEHASPEYKSIGAGQGANYTNDTLALNVSLGAITSQVQLGLRSDNVDNAVAFLKNRARTLNYTLGAPLGQMIDTAKPPVWAPTLSFNYIKNSNFADAAYIPVGQTLANLPNVDTFTHGLGLNWVVNKLSFGYQYSRNLQDNNQLGLELQDLVDTGHNFTAAYQASERLGFTGSAGKRASLAKDTGVQRFSNNGALGLNWLFGDRYTLTSNLSVSTDRDSLLTTDTKALQGQLQLLKQFDLAAFGNKLPGQWTLSYAQSNTNSLGILVRYQTLNAALSLSFF